MTNSIEFAGQDFLGKEVSASCWVDEISFKRFQNDFAQLIKNTIKIEKSLLEKIPNAQIITVDFKKKKVDANRQPHPNPPPENEESKAILKGAGKIAKAAGVDTVEVELLVKKKGLPAFKIPGRQFWFAFPEEIEKWKKEQEGGNHA